MTIRVGIALLPELSWRHARSRWLDVERMSFAHAWTYDHLTWRWFRDRSWFASIPTLTAVAATTSQLRFGTLVASPNFRHPVPFAKEISTLDDISSGRFILGIGAGAPEGFDVSMLRSSRWSARERTDRFAEFVELTHLLLTQPLTTYHGRYYQAYEAISHPAPRSATRLPLALAATGPRGMALAARFAEMWMTTGAPNHFERLPYTAALPLVRQQVEQMTAACDREGRDPQSLRRMLVTGPMISGMLDSIESCRDALGRYAEAGITDAVIHWPRDEEPYQGRLSVLEQLAEDLAAVSVGEA